MRQTHHLTWKRKKCVANNLTVTNGSEQSSALRCLRKSGPRQETKSLSRPVTQRDDLINDLVILDSEPRQIYLEGRRSMVGDLYQPLVGIYVPIWLTQRRC